MGELRHTASDRGPLPLTPPGPTRPKALRPFFPAPSLIFQAYQGIQFHHHPGDPQMCFQAQLSCSLYARIQLYTQHLPLETDEHLENPRSKAEPWLSPAPPAPSVSPHPLLPVPANAMVIPAGTQAETQGSALGPSLLTPLPLHGGHSLRFPAAPSCPFSACPDSSCLPEPALGRSPIQVSGSALLGHATSGWAGPHTPASPTGITPDHSLPVTRRQAWPSHRPSSDVTGHLTCKPSKGHEHCRLLPHLLLDDGIYLRVTH